MFARQPIASISFFLLLTLFSVLTRDIAGAQERWPPWQSYGEAENTNRKKDLRRQGRLQTDASLDRQITQLKAAGKYAEAVPFAQRALALAEKKGANSLAVAKALDTLAGLYEAQNKYAEAEPLLKRSLAIREKAPGQPGVAASRERLAVAYDKTGRAADAQALRGQRTVLDEKSGGGRAAKNGDGQADNEAAAQKRAEEAKAEADRRAAEQRAKEQSAQAEQQRAQAQQKKEEPATAPGRQFHARRMARPSEPLGSGAPSSEAAPAQNEAVDRTAKEDQPGSPAPEAGEQEMTPQAAPPAKVTQAPKPAAEPPLPGAFGGAPPPMDAAPPSADGEPSDDAAAAPPPPPPVAEAPSAPGTSEPPPPVASAPPTAGPSLDGGAGFGRGRNMATPAQPPPMASQPPGTTPIVQPTEPSATEAGGGAATAAEPDWHVVPVYWGTDRAVQPNAKRLAYGSDRARKLQLGEAMVTVPNVHKVPNIERPWVVKVPYFDVTLYEQKEDPKSHFTIKEIKALTREQLLAQVKARLKDSKLFKDQAVVFVHGYNTSFDNGLYRTAQIAYDLDFDGATFLYSWPSGGAVASYTYDRESAQASEPYLREFLEMVVQADRRQTGEHHRPQHGQPAADGRAARYALIGPGRRRDQSGDPRRARRRCRQFLQPRQDYPGLRQERDAVCRLQRSGVDRVAQLLGQLPGRRCAARRSADPAGHRHDRRHGGVNRHLRHQPLGVRLEQ